MSKNTAFESISFEGTTRQIADQLLLQFPAGASAELPSRGQVAVRGRLNGHEFATVIEPDGLRGHWLSIDEDLQAATGLGADENAALEVEPANEWPEPTVPDDLRAALDEASDLHDTWREITPMARWEWVRWVNATANPSTRARRVAVSISKLRDGKRRPCCFDLSSCTVPEVSKSGKLIDA